MSGSNEEVEMVLLLKEILKILKKIERNQPNPLD
jgi:hypothetical protein